MGQLQELFQDIILRTPSSHRNHRRKYSGIHHANMVSDLVYVIQYVLLQGPSTEIIAKNPFH